jgi:hypothetical protein
MSSAHQTRWRDLVRLQRRYRRSIHLERDFSTEEALAGYVLTPLVRATIARVADGLLGDGGRAWSFTGPYGSGKSAFAVYLANLFHYSPERHSHARRLLEAADPDLYRRLFSQGELPLLCPVLATGERKSLEAVVLGALAEASRGFWGGSKSAKLTAELQRAATSADRGGRVSARDVVRHVERFADRLSQSKRRGSGLLVLVDEAGKALEFASQYPDRGDVHLLQELAELATRSGERPLVIGVLLHQSFDQYASRLGSSQRNEWAKVQGRYEDVPFQEAADQILRLISRALNVRHVPEEFRRQARECIDDVVSSVNPPGLPDKAKLAHTLAETLPLHPVTALLLGPLFRSQFSQNERSLFAFLSSAEPGAFQDFLAMPVSHDGTLETYRPDRLFNYLGATFGERLYRHGGRQWALIHDALARLPTDASELDARVVKTVGLLGMLGEAAGIPASEKVIHLALADSSAAKRREVTAALERLKAASLLVYRRFRDSYQMWDGSDLDLEERIRSATAQLDPRAKLLNLLCNAVPPRPIVARRHLFESGTLRYFEVRYGDESVIDAEWDGQDTRADGVVWLLIPTSDTAGDALKRRLNRLEAWLAHSDTSKPVVVGIMNEAGRLREAAVALAALDWVRTHTPELASDPVARKEIAGRILDAENVLRGEMGAFLNGDREAVWNHRGISLTINNGRQLGAELSKLCAQVYGSAPRVLNELINRNQLSSAAAAARRELMVAMATRREKRKLGIDGAPPELSMYRSILEMHRMHREGENGTFVFTNPSKDAGSFLPAIRAIRKALGIDGGRVSVRRVYDVLTRPPFGLKEGVIPIVLLWTLLKEEAETALYEEGAFVPVIDAPVIERFGRRPEGFELQRFQIQGAREELFEEMTGSDQTAEQGPLVLVRQFVKIVQELPAYARNTRELSQDAIQVRDAILRAKEPGSLIFNELPAACGFPALSSAKTKTLPVGLVQALQNALKELRIAYPRLLDNVRGQVQRAFALPSAPDEARSELTARARQLSALAADPQLKTFLVRAADENASSDAWAASLATYLGGRPPESWSDPDLQRMSVQLTMIARKFSALEAAFLEHQQAGLPEGAIAVRVSVTEAGQSEAERVVIVRQDARAGVEAIAHRLRQAVEAEQADSPPETVVAGLAELLKQLMRQMGEDVSGRGAKP